MSIQGRDAFISAMKQEIGEPYIWAKHDCSETVSKCLRVAGETILDSESSAAGLYNKYKDKKVERLQAPPGSLYFYGDDANHITHVMAVCAHWDSAGIVLIGTRGGDNTTLTPEDAARRRAFTDAVWGDYWLYKFVAAVDPFAENDVGDETIIQKP